MREEREREREREGGREECRGFEAQIAEKRIDERADPSEGR